MATDQLKPRIAKPPPRRQPKGAGFFGFGGSDSSASQSNQTGGDASQQTRGNNNATFTAGSKGASGSNSRYVESGGIDLSNSKSNFGLQIGATKGNVTINDLGAVSDLAGKFTDTIASITSSTNAALSGAIGSQGSQVSSALEKISDVGTNAQTGGDSSRNKIVLYVVMAALAALVAIFYFKK